MLTNMKQNNRRTKVTLSFSSILRQHSTRSHELFKTRLFLPCQKGHSINKSKLKGTEVIPKRGNVSHIAVKKKYNSYIIQQRAGGELLRVNFYQKSVQHFESLHKNSHSWEFEIISSLVSNEGIPAPFYQLRSYYSIVQYI